MFRIYVMICVLASLFLTSYLYADTVSITRVNQNGDIIDGPEPVEYLGNWDERALKISDAGYIYYRPGDDNIIICYDSSLNYINADGMVSPALGIDNVRDEIVSGHTITRYNPTLSIIDHFEVEGDSLYYLTVDESDGSIWYGTYHGAYLYKIAHDGSQIYVFSSNAGQFSNMSPSRKFWVRCNDLELRNSSDGSIISTCAVSEPVIGLTMNFSDDSCWFIAWNWDSSAVVKVNGSGTIVYNNSTDFLSPYNLDIDQSDGSVWIADTNHKELVHLDANGNELLRKDWGEWIFDVAVDPSDGTVVIISSTDPANIESASLGKIKATYAEERDE